MLMPDTSRTKEDVGDQTDQIDHKHLKVITNIFNLSYLIFKVTSMLMMDVGDEMCWWKL